MVIQMTPELEANLTKLAAHQGKSPEEYLLGVARNLVDHRLRDLEILKQRVAEADLGIFIEEEEMDRRFQEMLGR